MSEDTNGKEHRRIVLVVGVDLSDVSRHLLAQTHALIRPVDEAEVHLVHVVHPEPITQWISNTYPTELARTNAEYATSQLQQLCDHFGQGARAGRADLFVHTPIGEAATQLVQLASRVSADMIVVEAHDQVRRPLWHRSILARLVRNAQCTVLTIRRQGSTAQAGIARPQASAQPSSTHSA